MDEQRKKQSSIICMLRNATDEDLFRQYFEYGNEIGKGKFAKIYDVKKDGQVVAVSKKVDLSKLDKQAQKYTHDEVKALKNLTRKLQK